MKMSPKWVITLQRAQSQCCIKSGAVDEVCLHPDKIKKTNFAVVEICPGVSSITTKPKFTSFSYRDSRMRHPNQGHMAASIYHSSRGERQEYTLDCSASHHHRTRSHSLSPRGSFESLCPLKWQQKRKVSLQLCLLHKNGAQTQWKDYGFQWKWWQLWLTAEPHVCC